MALQQLLPSYQIVVTSVSRAEREALAALVAEHGATLVAGVNSGDPPHVLITRSVLSPKYRALMRSHPEVPVVTPDWLTESAAKGKLQHKATFRVGAFMGLTICLTGLNAAAKAATSRSIAQEHGRHSASLDRHCTHLVAHTTASDKYRCAWAGGREGGREGRGSGGWGLGGRQGSGAAGQQLYCWNWRRQRGSCSAPAPAQPELSPAACPPAHPTPTHP